MAKSSMKRKVLLNTLFIAFVCLCQGTPVDVSLESFVIKTRDLQNKEPMEFGFLRTRMDSRMELGKERSLYFELHQESFIGSKFLNSPEFQTLDSLKPDLPLDTYLARFSNGIAEHRLKLFRAFYEVSGLDSTWTVGLQRIALGVGRIWNPLDVLHPKDPGGLQPELQSPIFGLLGEIYPSALSKLQVFTTHGDNFSTRVKGLHYQWFENGWDQGWTLLQSPTNKVLGFQMEGNLGGSGLEGRFEGGLFEDRSTSQRDVQAVIGVDYGFPNAASIAVEYFYNRRGSRNLPQNSTSLSLGRQLPYQGTHYLGILAAYPLTPTRSLSGLTITNLSDESVLFSLGWTHFIGQTSEWGLGFQLSRGSSGSEFGFRTDTLYLHFSTYF